MVSKKISVDVECQMMLNALNVLLIVRLDSAIVDTIATGVAHAADSFSIKIPSRSCCGSRIMSVHFLAVQCTDTPKHRQINKF